MTTAARRERLRSLLRTAGLDGLLVTDLVNVRYLTGFTGSNGALLLAAADDAHSRFGTDSRYTIQSAAEVPDLEPVVERSTALALAGLAAALGVRRLGYESDAVTVDARRALDAATDAELVRAPGLVARLRVVKDDTEIATLRRACAIADTALTDLLAAGGVRAGRTEREIALDLDFRMRGLGADGPSFDSIVAAGANSAIPHHSPTGTAVQPGDLLKLDFGALVAGYHSDMTRTLVLGRAADWQRELYDLVHRAQAAGCAAVEAGVPTADVDAASRNVIAAAGLGDRFLHGLGHGVGLVIHEAPALSAASKDVLEAGMAVTVEPGVYLADRGGVRIEDTLVVREGDRPDPLTAFPKELLEV
ncbi:M24 family metallopeptidase [Pseudonocardia pini]|uniref:M24 family metallopeptidase n=1 Tax=Pseudonocardia pini TaxID=2758030 RepID=UPI0015F06DA5|nr:aminopeptidase P family protein [Pseudonocardia pini]